MPAPVHKDPRHLVGRRLVWVALLGLVVAGLLLLTSRPRPTPLEQVPRSQLVLREGRWYRVGQATPFSGILVEHYASGPLKSRTRIDQGLPDGLSEGWYTNGQRQVEEQFRAGISHGLRTKWHQNGRNLSEVMVVDGKLHGTFRRWAEDGTLSEEAEIKAGQPDGLSRSFYPDGSVKVEAQLRDGQLIESRSWKEGEHTLPAPPPSKGSD